MNSRIAIRATVLIALAIALSIASSGLRADTGTCGGASITLPFVDVAAGNVFFCSIAEAYFSGLANGTAATHYNPAGSVSQLANLGQENASGLAFDGFNLWTTCYPPAFVSKVNPNTSAVTNFTGFTHPTGVMFDGSNIWVTEDGGQLIKIDSNANV